MAYTPSTTFTFAGGDYTPSTTFVFSDEPPPDAVSGVIAATLDDVSGAFVGNIYQNAGVIAATLEDLSGLFVGGVAPQGVIAATLDDIAGTFAGHIAPQGALVAALDDIAGAFIGRNVSILGHFSAALDDVTGAFEGHYNSNVHRFVVSKLCADQDAAAALSVANPLTRRQAVLTPLAAAAVQDDASPRTAELCALFDATAPIIINACADMAQAQPAGAQACANLQQMTPLPLTRGAAVDDALLLCSAVFAELYHLELIYTESNHPIDDAGQTAHTFLRRTHGEPPEPYRYTPGTAFVFPAAGDYTPSTSFVWPYTLPPIDLITNQQLGGIRHGIDGHWQRATRHQLHQCHTIQDARRPPPGKSQWIDHPRPPPVQPPGHATFTIPEQSSYIMQHSLSVTLLDLTLVPMSSVQLSFDADSYAWQFSGQLTHKSALPLVQQASGQPPVQLVITINGEVWTVLVERIEHGRKFGERTINISGHGLTVLLGQPYEQPASATQGSTLTVQQLADLLMPIGWSINWTMPTWLVPAGAYSYSGKTPIQALAQLTADIGAVLVPSRTAQTITIQPRYPVLPWSYDLATPDLIIPEAAIDSLSERTVTPSQANGVYVHGGEIGGVLGWCRLNGTDGARLAPTVSNALMTDVIGCRALGERILAGQYQQPGIQSLTLPMDGDIFPLASVGQFVQITLDGAPVRSIINSVQIIASLGHVRQTIQIGEETPNTWALFKELLPRDPLLVGTLSSTDGTTSLMALIDGGVVRVRGTGTVGNKYYLMSGRIDGDAPNMTQSEIVI